MLFSVVLSTLLSLTVVANATSTTKAESGCNSWCATTTEIQTSTASCSTTSAVTTSTTTESTTTTITNTSTSTSTSTTTTTTTLPGSTITTTSCGNAPLTTVTASIPKVKKRASSNSKVCNRVYVKPSEPWEQWSYGSATSASPSTSAWSAWEGCSCTTTTTSTTTLNNCKTSTTAVSVPVVTTTTTVRTTVDTTTTTTTTTTAHATVTGGLVTVEHPILVFELVATNDAADTLDPANQQYASVESYFGNNYAYFNVSQTSADLATFSLIGTTLTVESSNGVDPGYIAIQSSANQAVEFVAATDTTAGATLVCDFVSVDSECTLACSANGVSGNYLYDATFVNHQWSLGSGLSQSNGFYSFTPSVIPIAP